MLNELYIDLRSHSKNYPYLKPTDVSVFIVERLGLNEEIFQKATIHNICI